ncbi:MAG: C-terminal binding protein [Acidimicrobiales bacterium]
MGRVTPAGATAGQSTPRLAVFTDPDELDVSEGRDLLERCGFEVRVLGTRDHDEIIASAASATAMVIGYTRVDEDLIAAMGNLAIVSTMSVGVDTIDFEAAARRGIWITNVPDAASEEVSVHALALALALVRGVGFLDRHVRSGGWATDASEILTRPSELSFGVIGLGRIGRRVASLAQPIFGQILGHDPFVDDDAWPAAVERLPLESLLRRSDVVSLHLPSLAGGEPVLDAKRLALLPRGAVVVNVSRGSLLDEHALIEALDAGQVRAAGLDVCATEPPSLDDPLRRHPRVLMTPHLAYLSEQSARSYVLRAAENVAQWARYGRPHDIVSKGRET